MAAGATLLAQAIPARAAQPHKLAIRSRVLDVKGKAAKVFGITNETGRPGLDLEFGAPFHAIVDNQLSEATILHWHGLAPPANMDGVAMHPIQAIKPGEQRIYQFELPRSGTHWMHSHVGLQEQLLLAAPLIVRETAESLFDEQEHVVMIHDFTFRDPAEILDELKKGGGGHAGHSMADMDHSKMNLPTEAMPASPMPSSAMLNDITFDALLANDRTLDDPEVVQAEKGGRFRLRLVNACAATNIWIDLGTLQGELIAVDGNAVHPVKASRFPLAIAQRADIRLALPVGTSSYPVLFQAEGAALRAGIILQPGTAAVNKVSSQSEPGPALDLSLELKLKALAAFPNEPVIRTEMLMLGGGGADYVWTLNGKASMHDVLFSVREGERIDVMLHNTTSMAHPMHLHGHYFKVVNVNGAVIDGALRDTVLVPPGEMVTIRFDADNPGTWPLHCHHLYHMNSGMMGTIAYIGAA
jgi:FtsP/CotA-like multicopper oxidase with cupredoxin domain